MAISNPSGNYIDKITLPTGTEYTIVDADARTAIDNMASYTSFLGVTTTNITDGTTAASVVIGGQTITATVGNIVIKQNDSTTAGRIAQEYIYAGSDKGWQLFGDISANNLGNLAYKSSATTKYTPAGTINTTTSTLTSKGTFTPAGNVAFTTATKTLTLSTTSTKPTGTNTASFLFYTPKGSVTATVTRTQTTATVLTSVTGNTLVSNITTTAPNNTIEGIKIAEVENNNLKLQWLIKSTANAISATATTGAVTGVTVTATSSGFTGTEIYFKHPTVVVPTTAAFTGTSGNITATATAISGATFAGTTATITVS